MAWAGKRYDVRIAGFGALGQDVVTRLLIGRPCAFMQPLGDVDLARIERGSGEIRTDPHLILLISSIEGMQEVIEKCRQIATGPAEDFVVLCLIGDIESLDDQAKAQIESIRNSPGVILCFRGPAHDPRAQLTWSPAPIIQVLQSLIIPMDLDEYVDFDLCGDLRDAFINTVGYVSVAEQFVRFGSEPSHSAFFGFLHSDELASICRDSAVFLSVRGEPLPLRDDLGLMSTIDRLMLHQPKNLVLSVSQDHSIERQESLVTVFSAKLTVPSGKSLGTRSARTDVGRTCVNSVMEIPSFLHGDAVRTTSDSAP